MMADGNLTVVIHKEDGLRLETKPIPEPGPGQVQLRMQHVGICGTDLQLLYDGFFCETKITEPLAIGHESAGIVSKLGEGVTTLKVGDKVALESVYGCMSCYDCKKGNYNICEDVKACGTPKVWGSMCRYFVHRAADCYKLSDNVSNEEGALMEPLTVAIHSCRRAGVCLGSKVLVIGDGKMDAFEINNLQCIVYKGPIGVTTVIAAKASGATDIVITGKHDYRLNIAKKAGASYALNVTSNEPKDIAKMAIHALGGKADITIDSIGLQSSIQTAIFATRNGGNVTISGLRENIVTLPITNASFREVDIRGVAVNAHCYPIARALIASGHVNVKPLATHVFPLEQAKEAFKMAMTKECMKVMIKCNKD